MDADLHFSVERVSWADASLAFAFVHHFESPNATSAVFPEIIGNIRYNVLPSSLARRMARSCGLKTSRCSNGTITDGAPGPKKGLSSSLKIRFRRQFCRRQDRMFEMISGCVAGTRFGDTPI